MDERKKQALARAYARFLEEQAKKEKEEAEAVAAEAVTEEVVEKAEPDIMEMSTFDILKAIGGEETEGLSDFAELFGDEALMPQPIEAVANMANITEADEEAIEAAAEEVKKTGILKPAQVVKSKKKPAKKEKKEYGYFHPITLGRDVLLTCEAFGDVFASIIDVHDRWQEKSDAVIIDMAKSLIGEYVSLRNRYRLSRKRIGSSILAMTLISCAMLLVFDHFTVYEYAYNGRVLGYVDDQTNVTDVLDVAGAQLSKNNDVSIEFKSNDNITFKQVSSTNKTVDNSDAVVNKLAYMTDIEVPAYGIYEGGKLCTIVDSEAVANRTIVAVKAVQSKPDEGMKLISADFVEPITIEPVTVMLTSVQSADAAKTMALKGGSFDIYHIVNNGETISSIAESFSVEKSEVLDPETDKAVGSVEVGDKVLIRKMVEPIQVKMVEDGTMSEIIKYQTITENTDKLYKGDTEVKQKGRDGKQVITGKVTKINGEVVKRNLKDIEVITEVQHKIILVGTAKRPKTAPTGVFGMPIRNYTLTSRVGYRWGRTHQGLDLAAPTGTPIYASDGGTVTISGWQGGYGNVIYINHGNGYETRYGHNSKLLVPQGSKVYKGQLIALCGSTGNSTGPHLHFEIRKNGVYQDAGRILGLY